MHNITFRQSCQHRAILLFLLLIAALAVWLVQHMIYSLPPTQAHLERVAIAGGHAVEICNETRRTYGAGNQGD